MGERPNDPGETLSVRLFARFEVRLGERVLIDSTWPRARAKALIKLLALQPGLSLHREQVFELLWPELTTEGAAAQLRQNLYFLRTTLREAGAPESLVASDGQLVALSADASVDIEAFRQAAASARAGGGTSTYQRALGLCTGDLLPEDLYEEWTQQPRAELTRLRDDLLLELGRKLLSEGQPGDAVAWLSRLVKAEPAREDAQRELIRAFALAGSRDNALRQYQECRETLERELGVAPSPETEALYREIAAGRVGTNGDAMAASAPPAAVVGQSGRMSRWGRRRLLRAGALVAALFAVGGAAFGGLAVAGVWDSGGEAAAEGHHIVFRQSATLAVEPDSGDCVTQDLIISDNTQANVTGDITGTIAATYETRLYAADACQLGLNEVTATLSDTAGNTLGYLSRAYIEVTRLTSQGSAALGRRGVLVTGGTGIYENVAGHGSCNEVISSTGEATSGLEVQATSNCELTLFFGDEVPLVSGESSVSDERLALVDSPRDIAKRATILVLYRNNSKASLTGLQLHATVPGHAQLRVQSIGEEGAPIGNRAWQLPDLAPSAVAFFQFTIDVLSADTSSVRLGLDVSGDDFDNPVRLQPVTFEVVQ